MSETAGTRSGCTLISASPVSRSSDIVLLSQRRQSRHIVQGGGLIGGEKTLCVETGEDALCAGGDPLDGKEALCMETGENALCVGRRPSR